MLLSTPEILIVALVAFCVAGNKFPSIARNIALGMKEFYKILNGDQLLNNQQTGKICRKKNIKKKYNKKYKKHMKNIKDKI